MKIIKKITIVSEDYPAMEHPSYLFVQQLAHSIKQQGVNISVVAPQSIIHAIVHRKKLLPRHSLCCTETGDKYNIYRPYILSFGNFAFFRKFADWINKMVITNKVRKITSDVIYAHFWSSAIPVYKYCLNNKIPLFVACGEGDNALEDMITRMSHKKIEQLSEAVTGVISVSSENKRKCLEFGLVHETDILVSPNCVNTKLFKAKSGILSFRQELGINEEDFLVIFVGVFTPRKGPDRVANAIRRLNDKNIKVIFIGNEFPGYEYKFSCPGMVYKGNVEHDILPDYLNSADVFVLPTQKEGCCNAIVEALSVGLPVISSLGAFNDDILDDSNSIRVDPDDIEEIANAVKLLKSNERLRQNMREYSLRRHEDYSIENRARKIIAFMESKIN